MRYYRKMRLLNNSEAQHQTDLQYWTNKDALEALSETKIIFFYDGEEFEFSTKKDFKKAEKLLLNKGMVLLIDLKK